MHGRCARAIWTICSLASVSDAAVTLHYHAALHHQQQQEEEEKEEEQEETEKEGAMAAEVEVEVEVAK